MTRILTQAQVRELLPMEVCMDLMASVLQELARGAASNPLRRGMLLDGRRGLLAMMPGETLEPPTVGLKVIGMLHANAGGELDTHQGLVALFDPATGAPRAVLEGSAITAVRTAAVSGVATRALAREDAGDLALLGSGVQASQHLAAMVVARELRRVRVWSPTPARRAAFAERESSRHGLEVVAVDTAEAAVRGADLVCTATTACEPVLEGAWLEDGTHVNAAGACMPKARELDSAAVRRARVVVDRMESAWAEAGNLIQPRDAGEITEDHVLGELGDVLTGTLCGREGERDVTLFQSLGLAVQDLAAAYYVVQRAEEQDVGLSVDLTGTVAGNLG